MKLKKFKVSALLAVFVFSFGCGNKQENEASQTEVNQTQSVQDENVTATSHGQASVEVSKDEEPNALQLAKSMDDFSTLVAAIDAAGVQDAVVNAGPLSIFAPLNTAFEKLPEGTLDELLKPENKGKLAFILTNHVAPANYPIEQLEKEAKKGRKLYMASGEYLPVESKDGKIYVNGVEILKSVKVSNGWVHVIDEVLVPEEK
jgi:uncharacterized surface protein with fasciclin (FAS1) repeats